MAEGEAEVAADLAVVDEEAAVAPTTPTTIIGMSVSQTHLIVPTTNQLGVALVLEVTPPSTV